MRSVLLLILTFLIPLWALCESGPLGFGLEKFDNELASDRPDFTESVSTITPGHIQFESGYTYVSDKEDSHTLPELLTRIGIIKSFETRVAWEGWSWSNSADHSNTSSANLNLGSKVELITDEEFLLSLILDMDLSTGSSDNNQRGIEPAAKFLLAYELSEKYSLASNLNFAAPHDDQEERIFEYSQSLAIASELTDEFGAYFEYFGFIPHQSDPSGPSHYLDGGLTCLLNEDLQLDIRAGFGLNGRADDFFTGIGVVFRI